MRQRSERLLIVLLVLLLCGLGAIVVLLPGLVRGAAGRSLRAIAPNGLTEQGIRAVLEEVCDPELDANIVELGLVHTI